MNHDYGRGDHIAGLPYQLSWQGWAGYARYAFSDGNAIALRYECFSNRDGFATGTAQEPKEFAGTFSLATRPITRWEFRHDYFKQPTFTKGKPAGGFAKPCRGGPGLGLRHARSAVVEDWQVGRLGHLVIVSTAHLAVHSISKWRDALLTR